VSIFWGNALPPSLYLQGGDSMFLPSVDAHYEATRHENPEDYNINLQGYENLER
jgi:hypothetical protein